MNLFNSDLKNKCIEKKVIKVITGLNNFNINDISKKVKAAELGGATYIDVAAHPDIVLESKLWTDLPICVSSIDPISLYKCILVGADMVEIGNFDIFYSNNISFCEKQVLDLAKETKLLLNSIKVCVTIPHKFSLKQQIQLAIALKEIGIEVIQTEGISTKNKLLSKYRSKILNSTYKASSALSSSYILSKYIDIPIIASSGIDTLSAPIAISYGASGIGVGSSLNNFQIINRMANYINEIINSLYNNNSIINLQYNNYLIINIIQYSLINVKTI